MTTRGLVGIKIEATKRELDALIVWLKALEAEGEDCTQDFASIEIIRKRLDRIGERHGDK